MEVCGWMDSIAELHYLCTLHLDNYSNTSTKCWVNWDALADLLLRYYCCKNIGCEIIFGITRPCDHVPRWFSRNEGSY